MHTLRPVAAKWVVPVHCGEDVHAVVVSSDRVVTAADHSVMVEDTAGCELAAAALNRALGGDAPAPLAVAAAVYYLRQARRAHPRGDWDDGHRWYPDEAEWRDCCAKIRPPSRAWPWSLMVHERTAAHVAALYDVEPTALRRVARDIASEVGTAESHRER